MNRIKFEEAAIKVGGRFKFIVLLQKRIRELYKKGLKPTLYDITNLEGLLVDEILADKIQFEAAEEKEK